MSCTTTYLLLQPDGSIRVAIQKWGQVRFSTAAELLAHLDGAGPVQPGERVWVACRGWFIDPARRYARFYECNLPDLERLEHEREVQAEPGWAGWDVGVAWEQRFEVAALAGVRSEEKDDPSHLDGWDGCAAAGHLGCHVDPHRFPHRWDPITKELRYAYYGDDGIDLSVIDESGEVRDHHFLRAGVLTALGRGPTLLDELAAVAPGPYALATSEGALIDAQRRTVHYWMRHGLGPDTRAELRRRWPGWTVAREPAGHAGRLQRTGRTEEDVPIPWPEEQRALSYIHAVEVDFEEVEPPPLPEEEVRLLDAVYASPEADEPRLAYARYLTERGDRRGEFIAVQCELAALEREGTWSPRRRQLEAECRRLAWCADGPGGMYAVYRRGFPAEVYESSVERLKERLAPTVDAVRLTGPFDADEARALTALPEYERFRSVEVYPAGGLRILADAGAHLRALTVAETDGNEVADVLAAPGPLATLEELTLAGKRWSPDALARLLREMRLPALRHLLLYDVRLGEVRDPTLSENLVSLVLPLDRATALALGRYPNLGRLVSLDVAPIGPRVLEAVADGSFPALRHLGMSHCALDYAGLVHCLKSALFRQLTSLRLDGTALSAEGWRLLAKHPSLDGLVDLRISQRGPVDADALAAVRKRFGDGVTVR